MCIKRKIGAEVLRALQQRANKLGVPDRLQVELLRIVKQDGNTEAAETTLERIEMMHERLVAMNFSPEEFEECFEQRCSQIVGDAVGRDTSIILKKGEPICQGAS